MAGSLLLAEEIFLSGREAVQHWVGVLELKGFKDFLFRKDVFGNSPWPQSETKQNTLPTSKKEGSQNRKRETALVEDGAGCSQSSCLSSILLGLDLKRGCSGLPCFRLGIHLLTPTQCDSNWGWERNCLLYTTLKA